MAIETLGLLRERCPNTCAWEQLELKEDKDAERGLRLVNMGRSPEGLAQAYLPPRSLTGEEVDKLPN